LPAFLMCAVDLSALSISSFKREPDGEATISFCRSFRIENIALQNKGLGPVLVMPTESGGYKNLIIVSRVLDGQIKRCFSSACKAQKCAAAVKFKVKSAHLFKSKKGIVATVNFDGEFDAVFLASKFARDGEDTFRIKYPKDLKFEDSALKEQVRSALIKEARKHL